MSERAPSATEEVFDRLRGLILTGELAPGTQHSVYRLADELGHSRTPVREAVLRLADLGLLTVERNRGVRIRGVQAADVCDVFELRLLLEVPAAEQAARVGDAELDARLQDALDGMRVAAHDSDQLSFTRHDRDLHAALGASLGNVRLSTEVDRLRDSIQVRGVSTIDRTRSMRDVADEHAPIVEAVRARDVRAAGTAMREHLSHTAELLVRQGWGEDGARLWRARSGLIGGPARSE